MTLENRSERAAAWTAAATLFAVPLAIAPGLVLNFDVTPKLFVLLNAAGILVWLAWGSWRGAMQLWQARLGRTFLLGMGGMIASLGVSTALSAAPALSLAGTTWRRYGLVSQFAVWVVAVAAASLAARSERVARLMIRAMIGAGCTAAAYAVLQSAGADPILSPTLYTTHYFQDFTRPPSTLGHALYLGGFLLIPALSAAVLALECGGMAKLLYGVGSIVMVVAIVLSGSRSAILGLIFGAVVLAGSLRAGRSRRGVLGVMGVVAVVLTAVIASPAGDALRLRSAQWIQDWRGGPRVLVWRDSLILLRERPWFGSGPETFAAEFRRIESAELARAYPEHFHEAPHNVFLDAALAQGVVGLLALLTVIGAGIGGGGAGYLERGLRAGVVATGVWSLFANLTIATGLALFVAVGIRVGLGSRAGAARGGSLPVPSSPALLFRHAILLWALLAVAGFLYAFQDRKFQTAKEYIARRDIDAARSEFASVAALPFPKPGFDLWYSRSMASLSTTFEGASGAAALQSAAEAAQRAESTAEDRFNALYQSAALALALDDVRMGEAKLRQAIREAPTWYKPRLLLARLLREMGRGAEADQEERLALDLGGTQVTRIQTR